jgi:exopolysaccharide biosynthesis WecB/TagA/CpsF family protein
MRDGRSSHTVCRGRAAQAAANAVVRGTTLTYSPAVSNYLPSVEIMGVPIAPLDVQAALDAIEQLYEQDRPTFVAHANAHTLNSAFKDPSYKEVLRRAALVLNDGKGVLLAARLLGARLPADLNGNFFSPLVLELAAARGWSVYFLGARSGIADAAAANLSRRVPGLKMAGTRDGFFSVEEEDDVVAAIRDSGAGLLMVAMGNPAQERWLDRCMDKTDARLGVGVGAFFDFQAGAVRRAPEWMNRIGLEWLYRLGKEPRRMWRRYLIGNPQFVVRVIRERLKKERMGLTR